MNFPILCAFGYTRRAIKMRHDFAATRYSAAAAAKPHPISSSGAVLLCTVLAAALCLAPYLPGRWRAFIQAADFITACLCSAAPNAIAAYPSASPPADPFFPADLFKSDTAAKQLPKTQVCTGNHLDTYRAQNKRYHLYLHPADREGES